MKEFTCKMPGGKLKVRGAFKTSIFAYSMGISINFALVIYCGVPCLFDTLFRGDSLFITKYKMK